MKKRIIFTGMFIKTLLVICAVALVPTVLVGTIGITVFTQSTIDKNYASLQSINAGKVRTLEYTLAEIQRHIFAISLNSDIQELLILRNNGVQTQNLREYERYSRAATDYLNAMKLNAGGLFENMVFYDIRGNPAASTDGEKTNAAKKTVFARALGGELYVSELQHMEKSGRLTLTISIPVQKNNSIIGVFAAHVDFLNFVEPLVTETGKRETMQYIISDDSGFIMAATDKNSMGTNPSQTSQEGEKLFSYMKENQSGTNAKFDNSQTCLAYAKIPLYNWYFITAESTHEVLQSVQNFRFFIIVILSLMAVLIFFLALVYSKSVTREARETASALFESTPQASFIFTEDGKIADCNPAALQFYQVKNLEDLLENYQSFWPTKQPGGKNSAEFLSEKLQEALNREYTSFECVQKIKTKTVYLSIIAKRIHYNNAYAIAFYQIDLTEHKEAERSILQKDHLLEAVSRIGSRLLLVDAENNNAQAIRDALKIYGEAKGVQNVQFWRHYQDDGGKWHGKIVECWEKNIKYHIENGLTDIGYTEIFPAGYENILLIQKINGTVKNLPVAERAFFKHIKGLKSVLLSPVLIQDKPWGFITVFDFENEHEFSEAGESALETTGVLLASSVLRNEANEELIKAKETALSSTKAKSEFLSRMSHEIRTPLNVVIGMTKIAETSASIEKTKYCLGKINDASRQLLSIINDILDMSKIEADKFELSQAEFDFEKTIEHVCNIISVKSEEKYQSLIVFTEPDIPLRIIGDEIRLTQVLTNLLFNAIKFTPENGTIKISVKKQNQTGDSVELIFSVSDTGIGITEEQKSRLFNSFEQADGSISRKFGGTGLGLSICKKIVDLMGGHIQVESEYGKGSIFTFNAHFGVTSESLENMRKQRIKVKNMSVLAVDDSKDIREYFTQIMGSFKITCDVAQDGYEAITMLKEKQTEGKSYDMIFVDWKMPGLDGIETARQLKELTSKNTVIIMISIVEWSEIREQALSAGITRFIQKPLFSSALLDTIHECFSIESNEKGADKIKKDYNFSGKTILLAEDVEINREIFISLLEETHLAVDCAENGSEALAKFKKNPDKYDLILMDIHMPEMDGYTAAREIRSLPIPQASAVKIVAMTANAFKEDIEQCLAAGMNDHIAKPLEPEIVLEKLHKYLKGEEVLTQQTNQESPENRYAKYEPDIAVPEGIKRLMGKEKIYFSLLKGFDGEQHANELKNKIAAGNTEELQTFLHTIKGITANLSLNRAAAEAKKLEEQLKSGQTDCDFTELEHALLKAHTIIHTDLQL